MTKELEVSPAVRARLNLKCQNCGDIIPYKSPVYEAMDGNYYCHDCVKRHDLPIRRIYVYTAPEPTH